MSVNRLLLYVPIHQERATAFRAALIDPAALTCQLFVYDKRDDTGAIDLADAGNIESTLPPCRRPLQPNFESSDETPASRQRRFRRPEQMARSASVHPRSEFGPIRRGGSLSAVERSEKRPCSVTTLAMMASEIGRVRHEAAEDRQHPLYAQSPEGWLESCSRQSANHRLGCVQRQIYGWQVPTFQACPERGVIDLLGIDDTGRLVVIELKTTADLQLPFQALD